MGGIEAAGLREEAGGVGRAGEGLVRAGESENGVDIVVDPRGGFFEVGKRVGRVAAGEEHHAGVALEYPVVGCGSDGGVASGAEGGRGIGTGQERLGGRELSADGFEAESVIGLRSERRALVAVLKFDENHRLFVGGEGEALAEGGGVES